MGRISRFSLMFALMFFTASVVSAQTSLGQDPVQYIITPETPGPGQSVTIEVQGVGNFVGDANITWQVNGKTTLSGTGERKLTFTTGSLGTQTSVGVTIRSTSQGTITKSFSFRPATVNLLWEADTSVPPFYLGKALYSGGSMLKVIAIPQVVSGGVAVSAGNLSFAWRRGDSTVPEQSGRGRNVLTIAGNELLPEEDISVDVSLSGVVVGHGEIAIPASTPQVRIYEDDPLRGVLYDQALSSQVSLGDKEVTFKAEPYFFSKESFTDNSLSYVWKLNNNTTAGPDSAKGLLTLRQTGSGQGSASLDVSLQNTDPTKYVQAASAALSILFGGTTNLSGSLFGL